MWYHSVKSTKEMRRGGYVFFLSANKAHEGTPVPLQQVGRRVVVTVQQRWHRLYRTDKPVRCPIRNSQPAFMAAYSAAVLSEEEVYGSSRCVDGSKERL